MKSFHSLLFTNHFRLILQLNLRILKLLSVILLFVASSCEYLNLGSSEDADITAIPIARVKETFLYRDDLAGVVPDDISSRDSIDIVNQYVDSWIKKQLMIDKASANIQFDEADIERKVLDYRYALMVHEYEKLVVQQQLPKEVSDEEISQYYEEKKDNFVLKQNIIRGLFVKLPTEAPRIRRIRNGIRSYPDSNMEEIRTYCYQFANRSHLEDSLWVNFNEVIKNTPLASIPNKVQFLRSNNFVETSDDKFVYLLKLIEYKISDQVSPLDYVRDDIANIIVNKRKIQLTRDLENNTLKEAEEKKYFEKYEVQ